MAPGFANSDLDLAFYSGLLKKSLVPAPGAGSLNLAWDMIPGRIFCRFSYVIAYSNFTLCVNYLLTNKSCHIHRVRLNRFFWILNQMTGAVASVSDVNMMP